MKRACRYFLGIGLAALAVLRVPCPPCAFGEGQFPAVPAAAQRLASGNDALNQAEAATRAGGLHGWEVLLDALLRHGVPERQLVAAFSDPRMPERRTFLLPLEVRESRYQYRRLNTAANRAAALAFYAQHERVFHRAAAKYQVPEQVMLALLQVETACGRNTGDHRILPQLLRLSSAAATDNVIYNLHARHAEVDAPLGKRVMRRAVQMEQTFLPHVVGAFRLAQQNRVDALELRGSPSGALGLPQFLPGNIYTLGVDGDGDGKIDLFSPADAIFSVANYLHAAGWKRKDLPVKSQRTAIWQYNHSQPYVETILAMAQQLRPRIKSAAPARKAQ